MLLTQDDLKEGDLVAVMPDEEDFSGQPWIGQCLSQSSGDTITLQWMKGAFSRPWVPDRRYQPAEIQVQTIINRVEFTPTQRLTKSSVELLKDAMKHLTD